MCSVGVPGPTVSKCGCAARSQCEKKTQLVQTDNSPFKKKMCY